ncbi:MAG: sodium/solute symporter [Lentisphaerae bacterium]|nr:sodium/solute symporter [Lentisphaerota bacterium]
MKFGLLNYLILGLYLSGMLAIGLRFVRRQRTREDYFLAGRNMPWLPVAMSMFASLTSALTFMGLPAAAYRENVALVVVCLVSPLLAPILIFGIYPIYRRMHVTTSYEYIGHRYGVPAQLAVSALFILARLGWMGSVIYAPSLALSVATGLPLHLSILLMGVMATAYTVMGGMAAVLWTDVFQFVILVGGAIWVAVVLVLRAPQGVSGIIEIGRAAGHVQGGGWEISLAAMSMPVVAVSFFLQMLQDYGTDQVTVQRMLAVRSKQGVWKAVLFNAGTDVVMVALLLFIGLGLFAFYQGVPGGAGGVDADSILPHFVMTQLPIGVSGLIISAIFAAAMSSMDSGINSMATVIENDFVRRLRSDAGDDEQAGVNRARLLTLLLGIAATGLAFYIARVGNILEGFATFMSLFNAPVLALFLLGLLSRQARFEGWIVGLVVSFLATRWLQQQVGIHWVYYFPFSFACSYAVGWCVSAVLPQRDQEANQ